MAVLADATCDLLDTGDTENFESIVFEPVTDDRLGTPASGQVVRRPMRQCRPGEM